MFLEKLQRALAMDCGLDQHQPVLLGVSGGADSLALAEGMVRLGYTVLVAHLNHAIREDATADAAFVRAYAARNGLGFFDRVVDVPALAHRERLSIEDAARQARYSFLFEVAGIQRAQAVAVAHSADDQVETVLLHVLQGSGLDGLAGMKPRLLPNPWHPTIPLVRPLLGVWREEIDAFCLGANLQPVIDQSNQDPAYLRNRIRSELIPLLLSLQPAARESLLRLAEACREDAVFLANQAMNAWDGVLAGQGEGWFAIDRRRFLAQQPALQLRLIRRAFQHLAPSNRNLDWRAASDLTAFFRMPTRSGSLGLPGRLRAWLEGEAVFLARPDADDLPRQFPQIALDQALPLSQEGCLDLDDTWRFCIEMLSPQQLPSDTSDRLHAWLDAAALDAPLSLRNSAPGDRFQPFGMDRPMRLSDFWINQRIPVRLRKHFPLIACGERIAWVPGVRTADWAKSRDGTEQVVHLWLSRRNGTALESKASRDL